MHGCAVQQDGQPDRAVFKDLRRQLEARVHGAVAPAQADVAGRRKTHRLLARLTAVPHHARGGAQGLEHASAERQVLRVVLDLVADGVELRLDAPRRQLGRQLGHGQGVPQRREFARIDQLDRPAGAGPRRRDGEGRLGHDRREQHAAAAGRRHQRLQEGPQLLGLAEHEPRGQGDVPEALDTPRLHCRDRLGDVGQVRPQPALEACIVDDPADQVVAPQDDHVEAGV